MTIPPIAAKKPQQRLHHSDVYVDNYEWMREKESLEVVLHLEAENAYTEARTEHIAVLQEQIVEEIKGRTQETDLSVPVRRGDWWYYTRMVEGSDYGIHCRAPIADAADWTPPTIPTSVVEPVPVVEPVETPAGLPGEQIMLDDNVEAAGQEFFSLGSFDLSDDGTLLLFGVDLAGDETYTLRVRTLATGENLPDEIENTAAGAVFDPSGRFIFYTTVDDAWRPDSVWRHEVGTPAAADVRILHEPDESFWVGVGRTRSNKYLLLESSSHVTSETSLLDAADPTGESTLVWPRRSNVEYDVEHAVINGEDRLLIVHNDQAVNYELVSVAAADPQGAREVVLPHRESVRLESVDAFRDFLVLEFREDGLSRVAVARLNEAGPLTFAEIGFDEALFTVGMGGNPEWAQPVIRLDYTSFVTPSTVYNYDVAADTLALLKQQPVLGHYDPALIEQRREWVTAADGTRIPLSIVYRRDLVTPGQPAPTLLYGYGSYEISIDPHFSISRLSLLDRGMICAVAHVRGGGELGRNWYLTGKKFQKRNSFTDFIDCARHLIDNDYTSPDRLVAEGHSAGGLLMGAVTNMAPELFAGVLAGVPFVDPVTSMLDASLPLTVLEWDEWGNPLEDAEVYAYLKGYSPLENVRDTHYPRILAVTSLNDTRVLYVEPAKWVARLREVGADALLKTEMVAGHGGVSGRYGAWREQAFAYAWLIDAAGAHESMPELESEPEPEPEPEPDGEALTLE